MICETPVDEELTSKHVAYALKINRVTALRWLKTGYIPGGYQKRDGGYWYIRESKLREHLRSRGLSEERLDTCLELDR